MMKNNNECINVSPPLFISNVWINEYKCQT
jgi:hypothetical protein